MVALLRFVDLGGQGRDIDCRIVERHQRRRDVGRRDRRQIALHIDDDSHPAFWIDHTERLENAIGAGRVIGPGHDGPPAGLLHRRGDDLVVAGYHDWAELGRLGASEHLHDHRQAGDIGQRLAGQPGRGHAGRDEDEDVVGRHRKAAVPACLYGLPEARKTGYLCAAAGLLRSSRRRPFSKSRSAMDSFELNKVLGAVLGTCLALLSLNIAAGAMFASHNPEKPGYEIAAQERDSHGKPRRTGAGRGAAAGAACQRRCRRAARIPRRNVPPAIPSGRASRTASAPISGAWSAARRLREAGFNYSAAMKAQKGNWTPEDLDAYLTNPKARCPAPT